MSSEATSDRRGVWAVFVVLALVAAGGGGYALGRASGEDLAVARSRGAKVGLAEGSARGAQRGYQVGLKAGRRQGFKQSYRRTYNSAYATAVGR